MRGRVGAALGADEPAGLVLPGRVDQAQYPHDALGVQAAVTAGDGLLGDPEDRREATERRAAFQLQCLEDLSIQPVHDSTSWHDRCWMRRLCIT